MSFKIECPFCHQEMLAEEKWIGQEAECPFCSKTMIITKDGAVSQPFVNRDSSGEKIPSYLFLAIITTILCCLPLGIVSIVYAAQVNSKQMAGDIEGARKASQLALIWACIGIALSMGSGLLWGCFSVIFDYF